MSESPAMLASGASASNTWILSWRMAAYLCVGLMLGIGMWLQAQVHLNHDVAWITHSARWLLEGKRIGVDIVNVNPPLIWFISLPPALLVKTGLCTDAVAIRLYVWAACLAALFICDRLMRPAREAWGAGACQALLIGAAFAMAIMPAGAFGQREHFAFILGLPYCLLIALRLQGLVATRGLAVTCGVFAGIAFGFKPWLLAVPLLLELMQLARWRSLRSVWRPETVALVATQLLYLLAVVIFAREYLTVVVPHALATYWSYDGMLFSMAYWRVFSVPWITGVGLLAVSRSFPAPAWALTAGFLGYLGSFWFQGRGFAYHGYPVEAIGITLASYGAARAAQSLRAVKWPIANWIKVGMAACAVVFLINAMRIWSAPVIHWVKAYDTRRGAIGAYRSAVIDRVNQLVARGDYVYAFSSHPFPAFPTMSYTAAEWGGTMAAQFVPPAHLARKRVLDPDRLAAIDSAVIWQRELVLADFVRRPPRLVLIETRPARLAMPGHKFDDAAFYSEDPRFAEIWSHYTELDSIGTLRVFLRRD